MKDNQERVLSARRQIIRINRLWATQKVCHFPRKGDERDEHEHGRMEKLSFFAASFFLIKLLESPELLPGQSWVLHFSVSVSFPLIQFACSTSQSRLLLRTPIPQLTLHGYQLLHTGTGGIIRL